MIDPFSRFTTWHRTGLLLALLISLGGAACSGKKDQIPTDPAQADQYLLDHGKQALAKKKWLDAREYFRKVVDNYPNSSLRAEAKLGIGEAFLGEKSAESLVLAAGEFRDFLMFYPTNRLADRAQFNLAMTYFKQMHPADRDQTPTKEALTEFGIFFERFPNSSLMPEARANWRVARDRLSDANYRVGVNYYKRTWRLCNAAVSRFREILKEDPEYSGMDGVYFYMAECFARADNKAEAIPLFDRVVNEYKTSDHFEKAQKRLKELQAQ
jgi:outer membrane protein assembly factor BamD